MRHRTLIALSSLVWMSYAHPAGAEVVPGLPYERMESTDSDGNPLVYYVTHPDQPAPLAVIIQDGGCAKLFEKDEQGRYVGNVESALYHAAANASANEIIVKFHQVDAGSRDTIVECATNPCLGEFEIEHDPGQVANIQFILRVENGVATILFQSARILGGYNVSKKIDLNADGSGHAVASFQEMEAQSSLQDLDLRPSLRPDIKLEIGLRAR